MALIWLWTWTWIWIWAGFIIAFLAFNWDFIGSPRIYMDSTWKLGSQEVLGGPRKLYAVLGGPREVLGGPRRSWEVLGGLRKS